MNRGKRQREHRWRDGVRTRQVGTMLRAESGETIMGSRLTGNARERAEADALCRLERKHPGAFCHEVARKQNDPAGEGVLRRPLRTAGSGGAVWTVPAMLGMAVVEVPGLLEAGRAGRQGDTPVRRRNAGGNSRARTGDGAGMGAGRVDDGDRTSRDAVRLDQPRRVGSSQAGERA